MKIKTSFIVVLGIIILISSIVITVLGYTQNLTTAPEITSSTTHQTIDEPPAPTVTTPTPLAVVLPHHDVVKQQRDEMLAQLSQTAQPDTIILVSPNHFNSGSSDISTTAQSWNLQNGTATLQPDTTVIDALLVSGIVSAEPTVFDYEHGIKNLLGEVKQYFPESKIVPLIFKSTTDQTQVTELVATLVDHCADCGVLASVDMSHYQPAAVADIHDIKTLRALQDLDTTQAWQAEVDSNAALAFLITWAEQHQLLAFHLSAHTNSSALIDNSELESTSHIIGYYTVGPKQPAPDSMTFSFAGDGMFGREIGYQFQDNNFVDLFSQLGERTFWGTDIAWINLEGPVSDQTITQDRQPDDLVFNFSHETIAALEYLKLTVVSLGNNHTYNQGQSGLDTTRRLLDEAGIAYHGHPTQVVPEESVYHYQQGELSIAMISLNVLSDISGIEELIQTEKAAGHYVIVTPHWGNEYQTTHSTGQEKLARAWFAAGADLIIGAHPHVIQDAQVIDGKLILYSLGNFVFDQTFSTETQQGLLVTGVMTAEQLKIVLAPLVSTQLKPAIARGETKQSIIEHICANITKYCTNGVIALPIK